MKKFLIYLPLALLLVSCDSFLDRDPFDKLDSNNFYNNAKEVNSAVIACYNGIHGALDKEFHLTEIRSDNTRNRNQGPTASVDLEMTHLDTFRPESSNTLINSYWEATYHNIANCNTVLKYIDNVDDPTLKAQYEGEARFIRAYHYFNLVRLFGPVFIVTKRISGEEAKWTVRAPEEDVYNLIIEDLKFAVENLPVQYSDSELGRATQWAAKGILAKVYATLGYVNKDKEMWREARILLEDIRDNSGHELILDSGTDASAYAHVFSINNEMNKEMIFVSRYSGGGKGVGSPFANYFAPSNSEDVIIYGSGSAYNYPTEDLVAAYKSEEGDSRMEANMSYTWTDKVGKVFHESWIRKYLSSVTVRFDAENDWPILRYADVILLLGEMVNELEGPTQEALDCLNATRQRAGLDPIEPANRVQYRAAMSKERRLELAFENQRYFDLLRTGELIDVMAKHFPSEKMRNQSNGSWQAVNYYCYEGRNSYVADPVLKSWQLLLPIPYNVIITAPDATQNAGY